MIITRFAPSPTGDPHIGNIRTTLFTYLFAKKNNGKFLLRIEDTDRERHNEGSIGVIKEALEWLNLIPENLAEPMIQSTRLEIYKKAALKLVEQGDAYICTCTKDELDQMRKDQIAKGLPPKYSGKCRNSQLMIRNSKIPEGAVIRMKIPENEKVSFDDIVRGHVEFDTSTIDDQVILKSDGYPTYHLAHVIDDNEMQITHVIRAEEWLPSTPKHILLNKMLGFKAPEYAHVPVILSPTKGKLSKRDGAVGILEYKKLGYLPEAIINFMALLGWNPKTEEEYFTLAELEQRFDLTQVNKAPAVFDIEKLNHFGEHYLKLRIQESGIRNQDQIRMLEPWDVKELSNSEIELLGRGGFATFKEMAEYILKLRQIPDYPAEMLVFKKSTIEDSKMGLSKVVEKLLTVEDWTESELQINLSSIVADSSLSNGDVFWPVRVALSGEEKSPSPIELLLALGKDESIARINRALELL
jgi:glutamyl-tRNA synthetase